LYSGTDSVFGLVSTGSSYDCKTTLYDATLEISKVISSTFGTTAGAFYIKGSTSGVVSSLSFYRNCYNSFEGGAFYLINTQLVDTRSKFMLNNANYGGAIKCDNCVLTLTDSEVKDNDAFDGGAIYSINKITLTATRTVFYNNKAMNKGGVLAITNTAYTVLTPTVITFQSCPTISRNKADWGGFAYYDNDYAELRIIDSTISNHTAYKRSAFVEAYSMEKFSIVKSYIGDVFAPLTTAMHSVAKKLNMKITDSDIVCDSSYKDWEAYKLINTTVVPQIPIHTKFYMQEATNVSLANNKVRMCGTSNFGGVFWLT
jgi:predicted outer membrane repeat protein